MNWSGLKQRALWSTGIAAALSLAWIAVPSRGEVTQVATPEAAAGDTGFRRLNEAQYKRSIEQIFGPGVSIPGRFDPPRREEGLLAIGDGKVVVSPSGLEQFEMRAREIAAQVLSEGRRQSSVPCQPASPSEFDRSCATSFLQHYGRQLYRRPLTERELTSAVDLAAMAAQGTGSFYNGLEMGLVRFLVSPKFIFRVEQGEVVSGNPRARRLDDFSLASRISFLLWDSPPDLELLDAAARGDLQNQRKLDAQVRRLIASPRFEDGVRAFFSDMFGFERFEGLTKDQAIFPKFSSEVVRDAQEQLLLTIVDHLVKHNGDFRDLFTTRKTFINRNLGALYKVPVEAEGMDGWTPYTFGPDERRAGILSLVGFLMLDPTHEGRSSPTIRGKTVRELLLCQMVPLPPANVDFALVQDVTNPQFRTARQRLATHNENPACKGCHTLTDPIGLSLENYDAIGDYRTHENGALIDATGTFEGKEYRGLLEFAALLRESPDIPSCVVQRSYEYAVGRPVAVAEQPWLESAMAGFGEDRYRFSGLMARIATSEAFRTVRVGQPPFEATRISAK
jgi:hypothetical protein